MESIVTPKKEKIKLEGEVKRRKKKIPLKNKKPKNWSTPTGIERETPIFQKFFQ